MQPKASLSTTGYRTHAASIALIVFTIIALFWRVFFLGETLIDVATLNNQLPWGYDAPLSDYPYNRGDLTDTYVPRDYFVVQAYNDGETPLWNPYTMAGHPVYADGVTRTLSPFLLFYKFLDVPLGYSVARITELLLAALFMYVFLLGIGVGARGGLLGALVFALSGHSMLHLTGLGWWGGLMWLPLIILFIDRAVTRSSYKHAVLAGLFLAMQFFCGYMPNQVYYVGAIVVYYLLRGFGYRRSESSKLRAERSATSGNILLMLVVTLTVGLALSATQWVPVAELLQYSNRRIVPTDQGYIYLPPWYLATLVFPNLFGAARDAEMLRLFTAVNVSHDHSLYLGIIGLVMASFSIYCLVQSRKGALSQGLISGWFRSDAHSRTAVFLILGSFALLIMMAAPVYVHITKFVPVAQTIRVIVRAGVLFVFAGTVLTGLGTDLMLKADPGVVKRFARLLSKFTVVVVGFVVICTIAAYTIGAAGGFEGFHGERPVGSGSLDFARRAAAALSVQFMPPGADIVIPIAVLSVCCYLLATYSRTSESQRSTIRLGVNGLFATLVLLVISDLFWNSRQYNPTFDRVDVFPRTQVTDLLRSLPGGRVLVTPSGLESNRRVKQGEQKIIAPPNTLLPYGIYSITGKDQLFPKHYREFCSLVEPQTNLSHVVFDESQSPYFDLLNVRYVLTYSSTQLAGYELVTNEEGIAVYENKNALPRAYFVDRVVQAKDPSEVLGLLQDPGFDIRSQVVIDDSEVQFDERESNHERDFATSPTTDSHEKFPRDSATATLEADKRNLVVVATRNESGGVLVLTDNYYPGWTATVDGQPVPLLRANHTMRAIKVPAGQHMVVFEFEPKSFWLSAQLSIALLIVVIGALVVLEVRARRAV